MRARYIGKASGAVSAFGATFTPEAEVDDRYASKIDGNPFFEAVGAAAKPKADTSPSSPVESKLEAVHRGRGSYSVMRDGKEVREGLNKADSETFNSLSDADKAEYVAD